MIGLSTRTPSDGGKSLPQHQGRLSADGPDVLRYNVVIVGKFSNKGSWMSEAWRKAHPEEYEEKPEGPPARKSSVEERKLKLSLVPEVGTRCPKYRCSEKKDPLVNTISEKCHKLS